LGKGINEIIINPSKDLIFSYKAKEACKSCKRYNTKATCPPHIEDIDYYQKVLPSYKYGKIYYKRFNIPKDYVQLPDEEDPNSLGRKSSLAIHTHLLKERDELLKQGHYYIIILGSGSCKLCVNCDFPCAFPAESVIPMEGTGMDVVKMMKKYDVNIEYPVKDYFYRVGCILYD
jgi:predicted metal-binding protein